MVSRGPLLILLTAGLLPACAHDVAVTRQDADRDGFPYEEDCDDGNEDVNPTADEVCDGIDNDCDGEIDEDLTSTWYPDTDGDGYGDPLTPTELCQPVEGYVEGAGDCDDDDAASYPDATEDCDGTDNNCDGTVDEGLTFTMYPDADADGFGDPALAEEQCTPQDGFVDIADDCDDADPLIYPDAPEQCGDDIDQDCDGADAFCRIQGEITVDGDADISLSGGSAGDRVGDALAFSDDVDGDGLTELLIGAPYAHSNAYQAGRAYIVELTEGTDRGIVDLDTAASAFATVTEIRGVLSEGLAGAALTSAGDLDGDGRGDLLVGAWLSDGSQVQSGAAYVILGDSLTESTFNLSDADLRLVPSWRYYHVGASFAAGVDLSGDGYAELIVGAKSAPEDGLTDAGALYVLHGCPTGVGVCVDTNGDGAPDPVAAWATGSVLDLSVNADALLHGEAPGDRLATATATGGDFNGDGTDDIIVGAPGVDAEGQDDVGAAYVLVDYPYASAVVSSAAALTIRGETAGDGLGYAVSFVGDVDNDGYADVALGAPDRSNGTGQTYLVRGMSNGDIDFIAGLLPVVDAADTFIGAAEGDGLGMSVSAGGDINGDGADDLLVGAPGFDTSDDDDGGQVRVLVGPLPTDGSHLVVLGTVKGNIAGAEVGAAVLGGRDLDGDGDDDVVIGAPGFGGNGSVFLLMGGALN